MTLKKVLYITANPKPLHASISLQIGDAFLTQYRLTHPEDLIETFDVFRHDVPLIDAEVIEGWEHIRRGGAMIDLPLRAQKKIKKIDQLTQQFMESDRYIFVTPMWNFSVPPLLKAYIDTIKVARKTFRYTEDGPIGLLSNKQAVLIQARGDLYEVGSNQEREHSIRFLKSVLTFIGVESIETIIAEGLNRYPEKVEQIKQEAIDKAVMLALTM